MFDQDRDQFRQFLTAQANGRGLSAAIIITPDGATVERADVTHGQADRAAVAGTAQPDHRNRTAGRAHSPGRSRRRGRQAARLRRHVSLCRAACSIRASSQQLARDAREHQRVRQSRSAQARHSDRLCADVRGDRADRAAVGGLDRARFRQPAGRPDPPADRRRQCGVDRQPQYSGAGAPLRRRPRASRRDLQQDDAGAAHAARGHRARARSHRQPAAVHRGRAVRRQRRRHRRQRRRAHHHPQPLGRAADRAHRKRGARPPARTRSRPSSPRFLPPRAAAISA